MGLHGTGDETGCAQTKILPDGSTVLAADALVWEARQVPVLSSCHSRLETVDGPTLSASPRPQTSPNANGSPSAQTQSRPLRAPNIA
jgi:hypothetical protein